MTGAALHTAALAQGQSLKHWTPGSFQKLFSLVSQLKHRPMCGETLISESKAAMHFSLSLLGVAPV